jgi:hypothetical protein
MTAVCGDGLGFEPGPRLVGAACQREAGHRGPHCWRPDFSASSVMWSTDGKALISQAGSSLVPPDDLRDGDGTDWSPSPL